MHKALRSAIRVLLGLAFLNLIVSSQRLYAAPRGSTYDEAVYETQKKLKELGYNPGPLDGLFGKTTEAVIRKYQRDNSLPVTGKLDDKLMEILEIPINARFRRLCSNSTNTPLIKGTAKVPIWVWGSATNFSFSPKDLGTEAHTHSAKEVMTLVCIFYSDRVEETCLYSLHGFPVSPKDASYVIDRKSIDTTVILVDIQTGWRLAQTTLTTSAPACPYKISLVERPPRLLIGRVSDTEIFSWVNQHLSRRNIFK